MFILYYIRKLQNNTKNAFYRFLTKTIRTSKTVKTSKAVHQFGFSQAFLWRNLPCRQQRVIHFVNYAHGGSDHGIGTALVAETALVKTVHLIYTAKSAIVVLNRRGITAHDVVAAV